jgi:hypothetical protein
VIKFKLVFGLTLSFFIGMGLLYMFYKEHKDLSIFKGQGKITVGQVYRVDTLLIPEGWTRIYKVKFITEDNEEMITVNNTYLDDELYKLNDSVRVIYQKGNPSNSRIYSELEMERSSSYLSISILAFACFTVVLIFFKKIERYFSSF